MKTMVNVTRQSNLPVLYGSETPGIWLINWNITMHMNKSAAWRRTHFGVLTQDPSQYGQPNSLLPMRSEPIALIKALLAYQGIKFLHRWWNRY